MTSKFENLRNEAFAQGIDRIVVGALLCDPSGSVLLVRRHPDDFFGGFFELPSGNVEGSEPLDVALVREVAEETGITIQTNQIVCKLDHMDYRSQSKNSMKRQLNFIVILPARPDVVLSSEHTEFSWVSQSDAMSFDEEMNKTLRLFYDWLTSSRG